MTMTMNINDITVGVQPNITLTSLKQVPILKVLESIPSGNLKTTTDTLRMEKDKDKFTKLKGKLPVVIISSQSTERTQRDDDKHTGFMWADIDKCGTKENEKTLSECVEVTEELMAKFPYIIGYFVSPSGNGLKVLCAIEPDIDSHKLSFKAVSDLFYAHGLNIDGQTSDRKRPCFVCHDDKATETLINPLKAWGGERIAPAKPRKVVTYVAKKTFGDELSDLDKVEKCLPFIHPDNEYLQWVQVGMVIKDCGGSCAMWDSWSAGGQLYRSGQCEQKWKSFGGGGVGIGSIIKWARDGNGGQNPLFEKRLKVKKKQVTADDFNDVETVDAVDEKRQLPKFTDADSLMKLHPTEPIALIEGVIGVGDKLILSASSKAGKTWLLLQLAYAMQNGEPWLGHNCKQCDVLYVNFELTEPWLGKRFRMITRDKPFQTPPTVLNLRGFNVGWGELSAHIKDHIEASSKNYGLIILDPIYKMLGDCDENSNGDVAMLLNSLERIGHETQTATVFSHHHSKGNKSGVDAIERMSGAGVWGREPDAIVDITAHEDEDCWVVDTTARNYAKPPKVVVRCDFPNFVPVEDGDPEALKKAGGSTKKLKESDVIDMCRTVPLGFKKATLVNKLAETYNVSKPTARSRVDEMTKNDKLCENDKLITVVENGDPF